MNRAELKSKAKISLKGKYGQAILMFIVLGLIEFAVGLVMGIIGVGLSESLSSMLTSIASFIITALFTLGNVSFFMKVSRNEEVTYKELFSKTKLFVPYILIAILTSIFVFLWSILFIIPGIIAAISYSLVNYIIIDNPDMSASDVIKKSKEMMYGHKMDYFVLQLSFLGWILLGILTLGILYLWLVPYMAVTNANFYNSLKEQSN